MECENSIIVKDLKKSFRVYLDKGNTMKEKLLFKNRNKYETRYVLNGISFNIKKGEAVGLIGHNGCGKSTTLKLLNRIMYPDSGEIIINGKVSSLIELGAGFHPDMSGRENIYINASIFGLTKKQIDEKIDEIIKFSELEKFMDNPVRTYSSGMYMRLAFSVAINVQADILLIDEILAVGDTNFQSKCFEKLKELKNQGVTIVIVSHSLKQIENICDKTIWVHEGLIREEGNCLEVHEKYNKFMEDIRIKTKLNARMNFDNSNVKIKEVKIYNNNRECEEFSTGDNIRIKLDYIVNIPVKNVIVEIKIFRSDGIYCFGTNTLLDNKNYIDLLKSGELEICYNNIPIMIGNYYCNIIIKDINGQVFDDFKEAVKFKVKRSDELDQGLIYIEHSWKY